MNPTRCKMKLTSMSEAYSKAVTIRFIPVSGGSDENRKFYAATPSGSVEFTVSELAAKSLGLEVAALGKEYYFDITAAEPTV